MMSKDLNQKKKLKEKPKYVEVGSKEEAEFLNSLRDNITQMDIDFMEYNQKVEDFTSDNLDVQTKRMNQLYYRMMLNQCVQPLAYGVNPSSILQSIGMFAGVCLANKEFKQSCATLVQQRLAPLSSKLPNKYQKGILMNNELPIGADSAAMMQISWAKQAYNKMREPGANINNIVDSYSVAVDNLKSRCSQCGISEEELNQNIRIKIGQLAKKNPEILTLFKETSYEGIALADDHIEEDAVTGEKKSVWSGEFVDTVGEINVDENGNLQPNTQYTGAFTPRPPVSMDDMLDSYDEMLNGMHNCKNVDEFRTFIEKHDKEHDMFMTMMQSDGHNYDDISSKMRAICKSHMDHWVSNHVGERENLKQMAVDLSAKRLVQQQGRANAGVSNRKIPTKFEDILNDYSAEHYYDYSIDNV